MCTHYIDVKAKHHHELSQSKLICIAFNKLHYFLTAKQVSGKIGISLPNHGVKKTGDTLRLHGTAENLNRLLEIGFFERLPEDTYSVSSLMPAPSHAKHITVSRVQSKSNVERLRRRAAKRGANEEQMLNIKAGERLDLPSLEVISATTKQRFYLFVKHGEPQDNAVDGDFSYYGLSKSTTVPWF